jgi:hypothetical protein
LQKKYSVKNPEMRKQQAFQPTGYFVKLCKNFYKTAETLASKQFAVFAEKTCIVKPVLLFTQPPALVNGKQ